MQISGLFGKRYAAKLVAAVGLTGLLCFAACQENATTNEDRFGAGPITVESLEGLILEGEGPIPARLIYQSRNTISSEEDRLVLEAISLELDRLVELAGQLDDAVTEETEITAPTGFANAQ
ncbi:MAG: hypothetical protein FWH28_01195 [Clostridiales bacterium]|nr:hypothetical protein [Clostridiales bacterium]